MALAGAWNPAAVLVEDKASGQSLIQEIQHGTALLIIAVKIDTDKAARAQAVTPLIESGRVFLPEGAAWLPDYMDELASFPRAVHDDMVDSTTHRGSIHNGNTSRITMAVCRLSVPSSSGKYP